MPHPPLPPVSASAHDVAAMDDQPVTPPIRYSCADCGVDTDLKNGNGHFYTLADDLWLAATPDGARVLCLDCLEIRLGRPVTAADFVLTPPEIFARLFDNQCYAPLAPPALRQRDLDLWRDGLTGAISCEPR